MNEDTIFVISLISLILFMPAVYVFGMQDGKDKGKNAGIVFCMEKLKECKTTYDYLKLVENLK